MKLNTLRFLRRVFFFGGPVKGWRCLHRKGRSPVKDEVVYLMMAHIIFNGKYYTEETNLLSASSRGLRFGDGLFETIKSAGNQLEFFDAHIHRLWKGLQILQFSIPKHFTPDVLNNGILALLKKNKHDKKARIRLTVFKGDGGLYDEINNKPNYIIQTWPLANETGNWNSNGLALDIYTDVKKNVDVLSSLKHNNFLPYAMAALYAKKQQCNDAVLLNNYGRICDTTIANIFLIKENKILTPALEEGCIAGIMRSHVTGRLKALGYPVLEQQVSIDDLENADEVFLTNSIYNVRWVASAGNKKYRCSQTQKIYAEIFSTKS